MVKTENSQEGAMKTMNGAALHSPALNDEAILNNSE